MNNFSYNSKNTHISKSKSFLINHLLAIIFLIFGFINVSVQAQTFIDVSPDFVGDSVQITGINSRGDFCGDMYNKADFIHFPFVYLTVPTGGLPAGFNRITDIGPYDRAYVKSINDNGVLVGYYEAVRDGSSYFHAAKWVGGALSDLQTNPVHTSSNAYNITNSGIISGQVTNYNPVDSTWDSFIFISSGSGLTALAAMDTCSNGSFLTMNNVGDILGYPGIVFGDYDCSDGFEPGTPLAIWSGGFPSVVGRVEGFKVTASNNYPIAAQIFNSSQQIIGIITGAGNNTLSSGILQNGVYTELPALGASYSYPVCINDDGQVGGSEAVQEGSRYFPHGTLFLPSDAFGLTAGIHDMNDVVSDPALTGGSNRIKNIIKLLPNGLMLITTGSRFAGIYNHRILKPAIPGLVVNSTGDAPDASPGDGVCSTIDGSNECTLRAAIMESNALIGKDTISFDIPSSGVPVIQPISALPSIIDTVYIDGLSQAGSGYVEIDGSAVVSNLGVDGLTVASSRSHIQGLIINNFSASGIHITDGSFNYIKKNIIGTDITGTIKRPNFLHGIHISQPSRNSRIGNGKYESDKGNVIAYNLSAGIFVDTGAYNNEFRGNSIYGNGALGIDLFPEGVNESDTLTSDIAANNNIPAPTIIAYSTYVLPPNDIWVYVPGNLLKDYDIEVFAVDSCDESGRGEGKRLIGSSDNEIPGNTVMIETYSRLDSTMFLTATQTDSDGNTSEFSLCWPQKRIKLVDTKGDSLVNKEFIVSKISNDIPTFSYTLLDTLITDSLGIIDLSKYYWGFNGDSLKYQDSIKIHKVIHTEYSQKHPTLVPSAYKVELDNAKFDSLGKISYTQLNTRAEQENIMDHTTLSFSLVVSIEWDADLSYIQSVEAGFRGMANYMYDVSDGQLRFDTIMIYDNKENWDYADIHINTSNMVWPHVQKPGGVLNPVGSNSYPIEMPRQWFGSEDNTRNMTYSSFPPDLNVPMSYRTFAHEFGHYALSLLDEYQFVTGSRCGSHPIPSDPYGYMDFMYASGGAMASELSDSLEYIDGSCRNNLHWQKYGQSTWQTVDALFQKTYDGILAPILQPKDRTLPAALKYLQGPNDNLANLDYDVGVLVKYPVVHTPPNSLSLHVTLTTENSAQGDSLPNLEVSTLNLNDMDVNILKQGRTADNGRIWVLGFRSGDQIYSSGTYYVNLLASSTKSMSSNRVWLYGTSGAAKSGKSSLKNNYMFSASNDSLEIILKQVAGNKAIIPNASLEQTGLTLRLDAQNIFTTPPTVDHMTNNSTTSFTFNSDADGYTVSITDTLMSNSKFQVWAADDSAAVYFFDIDYVTKSLDSNTVNKIVASDANAEVTINNNGTPFENALLMSTQYPVLLTGLNSGSIQGGEVQTISLFPQGFISGDNRILIRYSEADLKVGQGFFGEESSLRIYQWNNSLKSWEFVGGSVDTSHNEVTAMISKAGVYAAFTTDITTDIGEEETGVIENLPTQFELAQNYPNPFNPSTVISFSIPKRNHVTIEIFNMLGQKVRALLNDNMSAGMHSVTWDGTDDSGNQVSTGIYLYRVTTEAYTETKKMLLLK